jgi:hypothetical protein
VQKVNDAAREAQEPRASPLAHTIEKALSAGK